MANSNVPQANQLIQDRPSIHSAATLHEPRHTQHSVSSPYSRGFVQGATTGWWSETEGHRAEMGELGAAKAGAMVPGPQSEATLFLARKMSTGSSAGSKAETETGDFRQGQHHL